MFGIILFVQREGSRVKVPWACCVETTTPYQPDVGPDTRSAMH